MKDDIIEKTAKNLEVLGSAWWQAKNLESALKAFENASKYSDTGEIQSRIASIYLDLGKDKQAYKASQKAAKKGEVKNASTNYATMGSALINMHCYKDAVKAFNKSVKTAKTKKQNVIPLSGSSLPMPKAADFKSFVMLVLLYRVAVKLKLAIS